MKGITAFAAMSGVDDRFITLSLLPADRTETSVVAVPKPSRHRHGNGWFSRMASNGWFAAALSLLVAFGVLAAIVKAGQTSTSLGSQPTVPTSANPENEQGRGQDTTCLLESKAPPEETQAIGGVTEPVTAVTALPESETEPADPCALYTVRTDRDRYPAGTDHITVYWTAGEAGVTICPSNDLVLLRLTDRGIENVPPHGARFGVLRRSRKR